MEALTKIDLSEVTHFCPICGQPVVGRLYGEGEYIPPCDECTSSGDEFADFEYDK